MRISNFLAPRSEFQLNLPPGSSSYVISITLLIGLQALFLTRCIHLLVKYKLKLIAK